MVFHHKRSVYSRHRRCHARRYSAAPSVNSFPCISYRLGGICFDLAYASCDRSYGTGNDKGNSIHHVLCAEPWAKSMRENTAAVPVSQNMNVIRRLSQTSVSKNSVT